MKQRKKMLIALFLAFVMAMGNAVGVFATDQSPVEQTLKGTADYVCKKVGNPQVGSVGGEWAVVGLARSGYNVPENYFANYYQQVETYVKECKGVLHEKKYTDYSRLIVALTAIDRDPSNVAGYNLLTPLGDFEKTIWQGINGPVWALIALDSKNYSMPQNKEASVQATREKYIEEILSRQLSDGGFSLIGGTSDAQANDQTADPDITGMVLQALAKYQDKANVKAATENAVLCLSKMQNEDGGYSSWGQANSESIVQVIVALTELGIPLNDVRFIKNGTTVEDALLSFNNKNKGFKHIQKQNDSNQMATEQALYALAAMQRAEKGSNSLYRMSDAKIAKNVVDSEITTAYLPNKNINVKQKPIVTAGKTFADIANHKNQKAIEELACRAIINGKTETAFQPNETMTRAEFATIVVEALGLTTKVNNQFKDVSDTAWYAKYVGVAYEYKIVSGTSTTTFDPNGSITRQEAASMVARAAKLCGMDTVVDQVTIRDTLAQFTDYVQAADWANGALAFCYKNDLLNKEEIEILPNVAIKRCEIAEMLFRMLDKSKLL